MLLFITFFVFLFGFAFGGCPENSIGLRKNVSICYSFHPSLSQYSIAERECNSFGATLVTMNNKYTNVYITQLANLFFKHLEMEQFWTNGHRLIDTKTFRWINGDEIAYDNLMNDHTENDEDCLSVNLEKGFWKHDNCFTRLPFVCEFVGDKKQVPPTAITFEKYHNFETYVPLRLKYVRELTTTSFPITTTTTSTTSTTPTPTSTTTTTTPKPTTTKPKTCSPTWTYYNVTGYCYVVFNNMNLNWTESENKCLQEESHLTSIHSKEETVFVAQLAKPFSSPKNWYNQTFVGFYTADKGQTWQWTDKTPFDYRNWAVFEPNHPPGVESCGQIWSSDVRSWYYILNPGDFNNYPCNKPVANFVCKKLPN